MTTATSDLPRIGKYVCRLRVNRDWTQDDLAKAAGISVATVGLIENGQVRSRDLTYARLAKALDIPLDQLLNHGEEAAA